MLRVSLREIFKITQSLTGDYGGGIAIETPVLDSLWADGTDTDEADLAWADIGVTLADGATRNLDLRALTLATGATVSMVEIRAILIRLRDQTLTFAKGAANGWTGLGAAWTITPPVGYYRFFVPTNGGLPTGAAGKVIDISNGSGALATYDLVLIGVSA